MPVSRRVTIKELASCRHAGSDVGPLERPRPLTTALGPEAEIHHELKL